MKAINRRDLCAALSACVGMVAASAVQAQPHELSAEPTLYRSQVFSLDRMPPRTMPNGGESWDILRGTLATGEVIALHESMQPAGLAPNPPHTIQHSEFIFVREGTLLFEHDGKSEQVGAGGVIFVAPGTKHSARNVGDGPAVYLVVAVGGDTK
jgi:mannose-6-phosphate isomerase-like protein (cupin superfamily)